MAKYRNRITNGYHSKREANRAAELHAAQKCGAIEDLREQVKIEILPKNGKERAVHWVADFVYKDSATGEEIWEDCKGYRTKDYILKRKMILFRFGKSVLET